MKTLILFISLIFALGGVALAQDAELKVISKPRPNYTDIARQNGIIGVVKLTVLFRADGTIGEITVVKALPFGLTELAVDAAHKIRFAPKTINRVPQTILKPVEYRFDIYTDETDKDLKRKAKIRKGPVFDFTEPEKVQIKQLDLKLSISLGGDGVAWLYNIEPTIDEELKSKIEEAVADIVFEPAKLKNGHRITVTRVIRLNELK